MQQKSGSKSIWSSAKAPPTGLMLAWLFPIWWLYGYLITLACLTKLTYRLGTPLASFTPPPLPYIIYAVVPVVLGIYMFLNHAWFRTRLLPMLLVWFLGWCALSITQSSLRMAIWRAMDCPIRFELAAVEAHKIGSYLPWRCDDYLNDRASLVLKAMGEGEISNNPPTNFVYRLLVFPAGIRGPVSCYSMTKNPDGTGTLTCKSFDSEASRFVYSDDKAEPFKYTTDCYLANTAVIDKALQLTKDAGAFYEKNKYRSYWCIPVREHYLLEFNLNGKYYYYDAQGREEDNKPAPFVEPIPQCMSEMEDLSRRLRYLPKMKSRQ